MVCPTVACQAWAQPDRPRKAMVCPTAPGSTPNMSPDTGLNPVISQLRDHLAFRRMECGMSALAAHSAALHALDPAEPNAGMARACIWQGLTWAAEPDADLEAARRSCQQAMALLQPEDRKSV